MRIFSVLVFKWVNSDTRPILLHATYEVSHLGIFQRGSAREIALFVSREVLQRSKPGDRHSVLHSEHMCHACIKYCSRSPSLFARLSTLYSLLNPFLLPLAHSGPNLHSLHSPLHPHSPPTHFPPFSLSLLSLTPLIHLTHLTHSLNTHTHTHTHTHTKSHLL